MNKNYLITKTASSGHKFPSDIPRFPMDNNFDVLRLLFALQVIYIHSTEAFGDKSSLINIVTHFPGVPAFFFISGFLIYSSYLNSSIWQFITNRFLRLFPGLLFVSIAGLGVGLYAIGFDLLTENIKRVLIWFLCQITLGQAYNIELFRSVGVGVINGALWSITTEILFYIGIPVIAYILTRSIKFLPFLIGCSFLLYAFGPATFATKIYGNKTFFDFLSLTPLVWGWMFLFGLFFLIYFNIIRAYARFYPIVIAIMLLISMHSDSILFSSTGNRLGLFYFASYSLFIFWMAFCVPVIKLPFDISYGLYIWHMLIINLLIIWGFPSIMLTFLLSFVAALISWFFVERPFLRFKSKSLRYR